MTAKMLPHQWWIDPATVADLTKIPAARQLRPRIAEEEVNVAYYNLFLTKEPVTEAEDGTLKMLSLYKRGVTEYSTPYFQILYVDTSANSPVRGMYQVRLDTFLGTPAWSDRDLWAHPDYNNDLNSMLFSGGRIDFYMHSVIISKLDTLCMKCPLPEALRVTTFPCIQAAFDRNNYVYMTTENGTTRLLSVANLVVGDIWGADEIFSQRYVSFSKLNLLPE